MYEHILVGLDGSVASRHAGEAALRLARSSEARITVCHVYGVAIHRSRFVDMEPGLPAQYHQQSVLSGLRNSHEHLMKEGFRSLSTGYIEEFVQACRQSGVAVDPVVLEGRSYVGLLQLCRSGRCDLIVLGAEGIGSIGNGTVGGTTSRILYGADCDVLVARCEFNDGSILAGVDGSAAALRAAARAVAIGGALHKPVQLTAAYDPDFHTHVFQTMSESFSAGRQEEIGLAKQETLHKDIINDGLGRLYGDFLHQAEQHCKGNGCVVTGNLVTGKAYQALQVQSQRVGADLIVVNRYGHHREACSRLGSNTDCLLRTTSTNVLVVGGVGEPVDEGGHAEHMTQKATPVQSLEWDGQAQQRLERVPSFVRHMARRAVEEAVHRAGGTRVSVTDFDEAAARFGMSPRGAKS